MGERLSAIFPFVIAVVLPPAGLLLGLVEMRQDRDLGIRLVVVSNWDVSLDEVLVETGLRELVDGVVTSVAAGEPKPGGAAFARGLALAGAEPGAAWHAGDDLDADVGGALAAGIRPVLVDRDGDAGPPPDGVPVVRTLRELPALVRGAQPGFQA